jgi:tRNA (guanine-N7-)-methyltransferase
LQQTRRLPIEALGPYLLEVPTVPVPLAWREVFGDDRPVEIEVGSGKGLFLITEAVARPEVNFLGIEISRKYQLFTANRIAKRGLKNVRIARADARIFLRDHVLSHSCQAIHIYFPDPWWKKRHHKRRLMTPDFCGHCARCLAEEGYLRIATDVQEYFRIMTDLLAGFGQLKAVSALQPGCPRHDLDYLTNFERKFRKDGRMIYRADYQRQSSDPKTCPETKSPVSAVRFV